MKEGYMVHGPEKGNDPAEEHREGHGSVFGQETTNIFSQRLGVAVNRALERRLGKVPSPVDVNKAAEALGGTTALTFVRHAVRVQEQLASIHAQLQRDRHATDAVQDTSMSPIVPTKRPVAQDNKSPDPHRETKRTRVESACPHPRTSPSTSNTETKPEQQTSDTSMSSKDAPIVQRSTRSDAESVELPRADSATPVGDPSSGLPIMDTTQPIPSEITESDPSRQTGQQSDGNGNHEEQTTSQAALSDGPGDSASVREDNTPLPEAQGAEIGLNSAVPASAPAYTRQPTPSSAPPLVANVPGIWAIQVGKPSASQTDVEFVVDQDTASSVHRWAARRGEFDPDAQHIVVHLVALQATAVSAAQQNLSQSPGGITPQAFALALRDSQPQWPDDGSLVLQLNAGQSGEQTWFLSDVSSGTPLDVSDAVCVGTNSLRIIQLRNMVDIVFAMYAAPPTPEILAAALEWEKCRKWTSFRRSHSELLPG